MNIIQHSKRFIKLALANAYNIGGISGRYLRYQAKNKALILAYHRVFPKADMDPCSQMQGMYVSQESLDMHMSWLKESFRVVPLKEIIEDIHNNRGWEQPVCAVTFDDGWKDNYDYAFPVLKKHNIPATIFLVGSSIERTTPISWYVCFEIIVQSNHLPDRLTGDPEMDQFIFELEIEDKVEKARLINNFMRELPHERFVSVNKRLLDYFHSYLDIEQFRKKYEMLSADDIKEMSQSQIDFGYHSFNHYMLTKVPHNLLEQEVIIPDNLGLDKSIKINRIYCYPDGKFNDEVISLLKKHRYMGAVSLERGLNEKSTDCYKLGRINIHEGIATPLPMFISHISSNL